MSFIPSPLAPSPLLIHCYFARRSDLEGSLSPILAQDDSDDSLFFEDAEILLVNCGNYEVSERSCFGPCMNNRCYTTRCAWDN